MSKKKKNNGGNNGSNNADAGKNGMAESFKPSTPK